MDLSVIPIQWQLYAALVVIACKLVTVCVRPPLASSRWAPVFKAVSTIALNIGWATNRLQVGETGVMVPREDAPRVKALAQSVTLARVDPLHTAPEPEPGPTPSA